VQHPEYQHIPVSLSENEFNAFILPHLSKGTRGPESKVSAHRLFNYILYFLYTGCQWSMIPIEKSKNSKKEIHYSNIFRKFKKWCADNSFKKAFICSVLHLDKLNMLDLSILHGDGTTTAAKKGGDNIGINGHKKMKGDKVVAVVDRNVNIITPFTRAAGNTAETTLLGDVIVQLKNMFSLMGKPLSGRTMSLDAGYDSRKNRKSVFNSGMVPNIKSVNRKRKKAKPGPKRIYSDEIFQERFRTVERAFAWEDKFKRLLLRFEFKSSHHFNLKLIAFTLINLRHFCG